jgi:hypothetical protein
LFPAKVVQHFGKLSRFSSFKVFGRGGVCDVADDVKRNIYMYVRPLLRLDVSTSLNISVYSTKSSARSAKAVNTLAMARDRKIVPTVPALNDARCLHRRIFCIEVIKDIVRSSGLPWLKSAVPVRALPSLNILLLAESIAAAFATIVGTNRGNCAAV